ncbi:MAG: kelch repeat-containing protein [Blastocatellia bacterium]
MPVSFIASSQRPLRIALTLLVLLAGLIAARWHNVGALTIKTAATTAAPLISGKALPATLAQHTATLLPNGKLLIAGGSNDGSDFGATAAAYLYDPKTGDWTDTGAMKTARKGHFAVLLQSGKVLVAGGKSGGSFLNSAEIYDPVTQVWKATGSMTKARHRAAATLLAYASSAGGTSRAGFALAIGGESDGNSILPTAEHFNPTTEVWKATTTNLTRPRLAHTASLLSNGEVLVTGGFAALNEPMTTTEIYDPLTDKWRLTNSLKTARFGHSATLLTNGKLIVVGGFGAGGAGLNTAEIFDAPNHTWTLDSGKPAAARGFHSASLLPNGTLFVAGGFASTQGAATPRAELYTPPASGQASGQGGQWTSAGSFGEGRGFHTATILANARVVMVGGAPSLPLSSALSSVEIHDPAVGKWLQAASPNMPRYDHTATLLTNGKILIAGGRDASGAMRSSEIYDPATNTWTPTADMTVARGDHTATLLINGKVLVVGGASNGTILDSAEVYDPSTGGWAAATNVMNNKRADHATSLLADGKVLVVGGWNSSATNGITGCDIYDPATNRWTSAQSLTTTRRNHTATTLFDGRVLAVGGVSADALKTSELYDPATGRWTKQTSLMHVNHYRHTATLLPNGKVLVVSGLQSASNYSGSANLFDPTGQGTWNSVTAPYGRDGHTATLLPNGKALIVGGYTIQASNGSINNVDAVELYDPARGTSVPFTETTKIIFPRDAHTATLLPNGRVLIVGGRAQVNAANGSPIEVLADRSELFDVGLDAVPSVAPAFVTTNWNGSGNPVCATGVRFQGGGEATGGNSAASNSNYPVVQLMRLDNEQTYFLTPDPNSIACNFKGWTNNNYASLTVPATVSPGMNNGLLPGVALMTVFVNGIPSGRGIIQAPGAVTPAGSSPLANLTGRVYTIADSGLRVNVELRSSTGEVRNVISGPNGEYIVEDVPTQTPTSSADTVSPSQVSVGSPSQTVTVTGSGFTTGSQMFFNGQAATTALLSSSQVRASLPSALLQAPGFISVVVQTAGSNTAPELIQVTSTTASQPNITGISPSSVPAASTPTPITLTGTNLINGTTQLLWNGQTRSYNTAQSNATKIVFTPTSADLTAAGTVSIRVANAGGSSNTVPFVITDAKTPSLSSLEPSSATVNTVLTSIAIFGANLINSNGTTEVLWNGQSRTILSAQSTSTRLVFVPLTYDLTQVGTATVRVRHTNSQTGAQTLSNTLNFTINQIQGPTISSLTPASLTLPLIANSITNQTVGVIGGNFASNAIVRVNGKSVTTSFISSAQLNATIPAALIASQTNLNFSVLNPTTNLTSNVIAFPINQTAPETVGSVLAYPLFSSVCNSVVGTVPICSSNTTLTLTNTNPNTAARVRLFFVEGSTGIAASTVKNINANQTLTMLASEVAPSKTGYVLAVAINSVNCPISFNFLRGAETATIGGYTGSVNAIPVRGLSVPANCSASTTSAALNFDGAMYGRFPSQVTADSVTTANATGGGTLLVVNAVGGNLSGSNRASSLTSLVGSVIDSSLNSYGYTDTRTASQFVGDLNMKYPLTTPRFDQIVAASSLTKLTMYAAPALFGMTITKPPTPNFASLLRVVAYKNSTVTIPVNNNIILLFGDEPTTSLVTNPSASEFVALPSGSKFNEEPPKVVNTNSTANPTSGIQHPASVKQQQPGSLISYTITPSGAIPTGEPIDFLPASRTITLGGSNSTTFTALSEPLESAQTVDASFCGRTSVGLKIGGAVSMPVGYTSETVPVGLHLTNAKAPGCSLPTDISVDNTAGIYLLDNAIPSTRVLGLEGSYEITPTDARFDFNYQPAGMAEESAGTALAPPLTGASLGWNFNAYALNTCPASITATANGETNLQVCQGQPINLDTPAVPSATYTWFLPAGGTLSGRNPTIASATLANSGAYRVQVTTPACVAPVETIIQVTVNPAATANAGTDQSQCKAASGTTTFTLNGSTSAGASATWSVTGAFGGDAAAGIVNVGSLTSMVNVTGTGTVILQLAAASPAGCGVITDEVWLTVTSGSGSASITTQPVAQAVCLGTAANFSVAATGSGLTYQWRRNGVNLSGQTATTLSIPTAQLSDAGNYDVVITSGCGATNSNTVALTVNSYESDLSPSPYGNCQLTITDWVRVGQIFTGTVAGLTASELQRADCAPRDVFGNGILSISDWVQAGRYSAALDPVAQVGGPSVTLPASLILPADAVTIAYARVTDTAFANNLINHFNDAQARTLRLRASGRTVEIELDARGQENAVGFSLNIPAGWRLQSHRLSDDLNSATMVVNQTETKQGRLGFAIALPTGETLPAGRHRIAALRFAPLAATSKIEASSFSFGDSPIVRELAGVNAETLPLNFARDDFAPLTVVSAADFAQQKLAVESIAVAFGENLSANSINANSLPLPTELSGAHVILTDSQNTKHFAPLFSAASGQIVFLVPPETALGAATVTIRNRDNQLLVTEVEIVETAPAIFSDGGFAPAALLMRVQPNGEISYQPILRRDAENAEEAQRSWSKLCETSAALCASAVEKTSGNRLSGFTIPMIEFGKDDQLILVLFGTGFRRHRGELTAQLNDVSLPVLYAGAQNEMTGLDQINLALPRWLAASGEHFLWLTVDGQPTNRLRIVIQ